MQATTTSLRSVIDDIRAEYERNTGKRSLVNVIEGLLGHVSDNLYSDDFHFILELIQNAVDSAPIIDGNDSKVNVTFRLQLNPNILWVSNNGASFTESDRLYQDLDINRPRIETQAEVV